MKADRAMRGSPSSLSAFAFALARLCSLVSLLGMAFAKMPGKRESGCAAMRRIAPRDDRAIQDAIETLK